MKTTAKKAGMILVLAVTAALISLMSIAAADDYNQKTSGHTQHSSIMGD